jgi:hypothetical protein
VQVIFDPTGFPLWVSEVCPGSTHDLTAARELVLPALYPHAARGLPGLADKGYTGAGVGIHVPVKHHPAGPLHLDTAARTSCSPGSARRPSAATPCSAAGAPRPSDHLPATHWRHRRCCTCPDLTRPRKQVRNLSEARN